MCCVVPACAGTTIVMWQIRWRNSGHFRRRVNLERERVDAAGEFLRQRLMNHAVALDAALSIEGRRHDIDSEMRFAAGAMSGVARVQMRFIDDVEAGGCESSREFRGDLILDAHVPTIRCWLLMVGA